MTPNRPHRSLVIAREVDRRRARDFLTAALDADSLTADCVIHEVSSDPHPERSVIGLFAALGDVMRDACEHLRPGVRESLRAMLMVVVPDE
ncbi:hypothetical protein [Georgenia sp. AZ-5]|uniref:hypothetical protein n=1 Tax=Georgenia sp. AZ-5 TaxID=3367526 RepID=UPI003754EAAC